MNRKASLVLLFSVFLLVAAGCSEEKITAPDPASEFAVTGDLDQAELTAQQEDSSDADKCITDIAITAFSAPASVSPGGVLPLSATVTNLGSRNVRSDFTVRVYELNSGITIAHRNVHGLYPGVGKSETVDFLVPAQDLDALNAVTPGVYTLVCKHDYLFDLVPSNNSKSIQVEVLPAGEFGTVVVNPDPNSLNAPWSVVGPDGTVYNGTGDFTLTGVIPGDYMVAWGSVPGWVAPIDQTLNLVAGGTISFDGLYTEILTMGTVVINPDPDALNAPWSVVGPDKAVYSGNGDFTLVDVPAGEYAMTWELVPGWIAPEGEILTLTSGGTITFNGLYVEILIQTGTVVINSDPDDLNAPWSLSGPDGYLLEGNGDLTIPDLSPGDYTATWSDVIGHVTPEPQMKSLVAGGVITFDGVYELIQVGNVVIDPDPNEISAPWDLTGPDGLQGGNGDLTLIDQPAGIYTLTWLDVAGYVTPAPETLILNGGQSIVFSATYAPVSSGETIGFWFDQDATVNCAEGAFLEHVAAYIVYTDPSISLTRGFECGIDLQHAEGPPLNSSMSVTFPLPAIDVGMSDQANGQYNYIVGFSEPLATTTQTVLATLDIFYLEMDALTFDLRASVPASIPGSPVVLRDDFTELSVAIGCPTAYLQAPGTCPTKVGQDDSFGGVRNLFR